MDYLTMWGRNDIDEIVPGLYGASYDPVEDELKMDQLGITHILSVTRFAQQKLKDITYKQIQVDDSPTESIKPFFFEAIDFIEKAISGGGKVVVHCAAGISRSATMVCAYLMWKNKWKADQAIEFAQKQRPKFHPNTGFTAQLRSFEADVL